MLMAAWSVSVTLNIVYLLCQNSRFSILPKCLLTFCANNENYCHVLKLQYHVFQVLLHKYESNNYNFKVERHTLLAALPVILECVLHCKIRETIHFKFEIFKSCITCLTIIFALLIFTKNLVQL